jgi:von Willebrand factor type A domain
VRGTTLKRRGATRLADLPALALHAERTSLVRAGLALALAAALGGSVLLARSAGSGRAAVLPVGAKTGVIVIDMSASVAGPKFERVANVIRGLATADQGVGLVMFSDTAYELLPPNSPTDALLQFERFFTPESIVHGTPLMGATAWDNFSGGTRISSGLSMGLDALRRAHVTHGSLLLISDLNDSSADAGPLVSVAAALGRADVPVRIVPVAAAPDNVRIFSSLFGVNAFISPAAFTSTRKHQIEPIAASWPWVLITVASVLIGLLTANELFNTRLRPEAAT